MKPIPYGFSLETIQLPETEVMHTVALTFLTFRWVGKDQKDWEVSFATSMDPWFMADNLRKMADQIQAMDKACHATATVPPSWR